MTLFERTKNVAKLRGYSLQDTARKAGLSQNAIYNWKNSKPSDVSLNSVSNVLNVSVDYLLGNTDDMNSVSGSIDDLKPEIRRVARGMNDLDEEEIDTINNIVASFLKNKDKK